MVINQPRKVGLILEFFKITYPQIGMVKINIIETGNIKIQSNLDM